MTKFKVGDLVKIIKISTTRSHYAYNNLNCIDKIIDIYSNEYMGQFYAILSKDLSKSGVWLKELELIDLSIFQDLGD